MIYHTFAQLYDQLFDPAMYENWCLFTKQKLRPDQQQILDLAGGTGRLAVLLAQDGYDVTVVDFSADMLSLADNHARLADVQLSLVEMDMRDLTGLPQYDAITCYADSLCYLDDEVSVQATFNAVANHLTAKGTFLFDVITPYQTDEVYPGYMYNYETEDHSQAFMWESFQNDEVKHGVIHDLAFFNRLANGHYERIGETHYERAYDLKTIKSLLAQAGFTKVRVESDFGRQPFTEKTMRWFFTCQK